MFLAAIIWPRSTTANEHRLEKLVSASWEKEAAALAQGRCSQCGGSGLLLTKRTENPDDEVTPCTCVCRRIFNACWYRYQTIQESGRYESPVILSRLLNASRPHEEYAADFVQTSRRALRELIDEPVLLEIFELHMVRMKAIGTCARKLRIDQQQLEYQIRRIEVYLGRVYRELEPYPLFPLYEYFAKNGAEYCSSRYKIEQHGGRQAGTVPTFVSDIAFHTARPSVPCSKTYGTQRNYVPEKAA